MIGDHKDLLVWRKAMALTKETYVISRRFPKDEQFGLTSQVRRAAVSVCSNIAEGHARRTMEFRHFLAIARGSLAEVETQLLLAVDLDYVTLTDLGQALKLIDEVGRMLSTLSRRISAARPAP